MKLVGQFWKDKPALTGRGRVLMSASLVLLLVGLVISDDALIRIGFFWLLLLLLSIPLSFMNLSRISFSYKLPESAFARTPFPIDMTLHNEHKRIDTFDVRVRCEAGTGEKAGRAFFDTVLGLHSYELEASAQLQRRGIYDGFSYELSSRFPLGLALYGKCGTAKSRVVVYPNPRLPPDVQSMLESEIGFGKSSQTTSRDVSGEFRTMREYLPGDHAKLISWPASTRTQTLIVKEMEHPGPQEVTVIFHSLQPAGLHLSRKSFERSLQLLSGLFLYFSQNFIPFDFVSIFNSWDRIDITDAMSLNRAMELLAGASPMIARNQTTLNRIVAREAKQAVSLIIVSNTPVKHWMQELPEVAVPILCMDNGEVSVL